MEKRRGSDCGLVDRAVASDTRGTGSKPRIGKLLSSTFDNCNEKTQMKKNRPGMAD